MTILSFLIPVTLCLGAIGLAAFFWSLRNGQYDDLAGDAERILFDRQDTPLTRDRTPHRPETITAEETTP